MTQTKHDIRCAYDAASSAYARRFIDELNQKPADLVQLREFASRVGQGNEVLDLGCGPGHTTSHLKSLGLEPIGVDLSPGMISQASNYFPELEFEVGDMFELGFKPSRFAGVLAFYCIVNLTIDQLVNAFDEMNRVVQKNGYVLASFHVGSEQVLVDSFLDSDVPLAFSFFEVAVVEQAMRDAGFTGISVFQREPYACEHPSSRCYILARSTS